MESFLKFICYKRKQGKREKRTKNIWANRKEIAK